MMPIKILFCANGDACKNITENGAQFPTQVRGNRLICSYCEKRTFKRLTTEPPLRVVLNENRGRPKLKLKDDEKRQRNLAQRAIAQRKLRLKNKLLKELGSEKHPEWKKRWTAIEAQLEITKANAWGKQIKETHVDLVKKQVTRKNIEKGTNKDRSLEWFVFQGAEGTFDLEVRKIDYSLGVNKSEAYFRNHLTESEYKNLLKKIMDEGLSAIALSHPYSAYQTKAREFIRTFRSGELTHQDKLSLNKNITFGFIVALYVESTNVSKTNLPSIRTMYRAIGDVKLPTTTGQIHAAIDTWINAIVDAPLIRGTRIGKQGTAKSKSSLNMILYRLKHCLKNLENYSSVFPWAQGIHSYVLGKSKAAIKNSLKDGKTAHSQGYRCLRLSELGEIFKAPSIHHVAMIAIALSSGLRPEELKKLSTDFFNRDSGALQYRDGKLMSAKLSGLDPKYLANPQTSVLVKLILSNPEFFDMAKRDEVIQWMQAVGSNNFFSMKNNDRLKRIVAYTKTPIVTLRDFRTTCATHLAFCGVPLDVIQQRLGHVSNVTTKDFYVKAMPPDAGAYASIKNPVERSFEYYRHPELIVRTDDGREQSLRDDNSWDTFLLVQFLQAVLDIKVRQYQKEKGMDEKAANDAALNYYQYDLLPKIKRAFNYVDIAQEERKGRFPEQRFDPISGRSISAPNKDIPWPEKTRP